MRDGPNGRHPYREWRTPAGIDRCRFCTAASSERCFRCGRPVCPYHALPEWQRCEACEVEYLTYDGTRRNAPSPQRPRRRCSLALLNLMLWCARYPMRLVSALFALGELLRDAPAPATPRNRRERFMSEKLW